MISISSPVSAEMLSQEPIVGAATDRLDKQVLMNCYGEKLTPEIKKNFGKYSAEVTVTTKRSFPFSAPRDAIDRFYVLGYSVNKIEIFERGKEKK